VQIMLSRGGEGQLRAFEVSEYERGCSELRTDDPPIGLIERQRLRYEAQSIYAEGKLPAMEFG